MTLTRIAIHGFILAATACVAVGCAKGHNTELMSASRSGDVEQVRALLKNHSAVNFGDADGDTALHAAAKHGQVDVIQVLVREGHAKIDARDEDAQTPLHLACKKGQLDAVKALLDLGANVNAKDKDKWTALHFAAREGSSDVVTLLLSKGAEVNALAHDGGDLITPYDLAKDKEHMDVCDVLETKGGRSRDELHHSSN